MARWTSRLTTVRFEDALGAGLTIGPGPGDLSIGDQNAENAEHIVKLDRGVHDDFVLGDDLIQECSITTELRNQTLTEASLARILDFIKKRGLFAGATSLSPTVWAWKTIVTMSDGVTTTTKTLPKCEGGYAVAEAKEGHTVATSFRNHLPVIDS